MDNSNSSGGDSTVQELERFAQRMVGQRCWWAMNANGESLQLEIGDSVMEEDGHRRGRWTFSTDAAVWTVDPERPSTEEELRALEDVVETISISPELIVTIRFERGATLTVVPDPDSYDESDDQDDYWFIHEVGQPIHVALPGPSWRREA